MAYFSFQLVSNSNISVNIDETRRLARIEMQKQISMKKAELSKLRYIIETCLYLLWSHLDYFMLLGVPETLISRNKTQPESKYLREMFLNLNLTIRDVCSVCYCKYSCYELLVGNQRTSPIFGRYLINKFSRSFQTTHFSQ